MKISVITASYNYSDYIKEAIESVLAQTFQDWELIIIDDGSSDDSVEVIKSYCEKDARIKLFTHEGNVNKGLKETLLLGIEKSEGDWIAFLESDDKWREDYLEKKVLVTESYPEISLVFNNVEIFGDEKKIYLLKNNFENNNKTLLKKPFPREMFKEFNVDNKILTFSAMMAKRDLLANADFNTPFDKLLDWWLYVNISYSQKFYYIPEKITFWRLHSDSYINDKSKSFHFLNIAAYLNVFKREKKLWILLFAMYSFVISAFVKVIRKSSLYRILLIRKIKTILGIPLKDSPLF